MSGSFSTLVVLLGIASSAPSTDTVETAGGWQKLDANPVLGADLGTCFDVSVLRDDDKFRMWFSWRPKNSVALVESRDGVHWSEPIVVLGPNPKTDWEERINRPVVLEHDGVYHLWYTGQTRDRSWIGYATSRDGANWTRVSPQPVLSAEPGWEKQVAVMCPHVLWDDREQLYRMWYSGGEQYEPNAIGYATSPDGMKWTRHPGNPVFRPDQNSVWERHKVTACQVIREDAWYVMFYIGFADEHTAQIGIARSRDGITGWQRHPDNPVIRARLNRDAWDYDACYKPYVLFHEGRWMLWYNGRKGGVEQIGLATHPGRELWPEPDAAPVSQPSVLEADTFGHYVDDFNRHDEELYIQHIDNAAAWDFLRGNIPLFECPDKELERIYYFRWWTYRRKSSSRPSHNI